jgi:hypothetical protein
VLELFATSPKALLGLLSAKLFNDAVAAGYTDVLASSMDVAARAMNGGYPIACMLDSASIPSSSIVTVLSNSNVSAQAMGLILGQGVLGSSKVAAVLNDASITVSKIYSAVAAIPANNAQSMLYSWIDGGADYDKLLQVILTGATDYSVTANTTLTTGVNRYKTLSIASGVTLTLGAGPGVIVADTVSNSGTIASGWTSASGGSPGASGAGAGGGGAGAVIIVARSITIGTITANGAAGEAGSTVAASASGGAGGAGNFWLISGDTVPSGGNGDYTTGGAGNPNGGGGGGGYDNYGGAGGTATTSTYSVASDLLKDLFKPLVDWWLVNVMGKTPSSTRSLPSLGGSGGGGGSARDTTSASGGGGGGGGQIIVYGTSVTAGTVNAIGGGGGAGGAEGSYDCGGGGGGGGIIYIFYKSLTGTFTYDVSGGAGGTGDYAGAAGGAGAFRAIAV